MGRFRKLAGSELHTVGAIKMSVVVNTFLILREGGEIPQTGRERIPDSWSNKNESGRQYFFNIKKQESVSSLSVCLSVCLSVFLLSLRLHACVRNVMLNRFVAC